MRRVRAHLLALRSVGMATLATLIVGLPLLANRMGAWGLLASLAALFVLGVTQMMLTYVAMRRVGPRPRFLAMLKFSWPFTAPRAPEELVAACTRDVPPIILLHAFATPEDFARVTRPMLYDAVVVGRQPDAAVPLIRYLGDAEVRRILDTALPDDGDVYCPRCGAAYYRDVATCSDCPDSVATQSTAARSSTHV